MKNNIKLIKAGLLFVLVFAAGCKDYRTVNSVSEKEKIDKAIESVVLDYPGKENILASAAERAKITSSGYDKKAYTIEFKADVPNNTERKTDITFVLNGSVVSKERTYMITGFKQPSPNPSPQESIDEEAGKVKIDVPGKAAMLVTDLTQDKIEDSDYDKGKYLIEYKNIQKDEANRRADITFVLKLKGGALESRQRTVTVDGFKHLELTTITAEELITAAGLNKGGMTASSAAGKIAEGNSVSSNIVFTANKIVSYDDKTGKLKVSVKGTKDGKVFDQVIELEGFTHPYAKSPRSLRKCEFNFDNAIEHNMSLDKYIIEVNKDIKSYLTFSFGLENSADIISLGEENDNYILSAEVIKDGEELKVNPSYKIKYRKLEEGQTVPAVETEPYNVSYGEFSKQKRPYFNEKNVFDYVLLKVKDDLINVDQNKFASEFYAMAKGLGATPGGLINEAGVFKKYKDIYAEKEDGEHMAIKLAAGLYNPKTDVSADDYKGALTLRYCIDVEDKMAPNPQTGVTAISESRIYEGFRIINEAALNELFTCTLVKGESDKIQSSDKDAWQEAWRKKNILKQSLLKGEFGSYIVEQILLPPAKDSYHLSINAYKPSEVFALSEKQGLSKGRNDEFILINNIQVEKKGGEAGEMDLHITFSFEGHGAAIVKTIRPLV